ncbi:MAG: hypothetical protein PHI98_06090 [Eubacteriales bacterium]|nr:hypothetical protein [Eubacteriales bacterium]
MKKVLAIVLATMMLLCSAVAMAEEAAIEVGAVENGVAVPFTDYGFEITLPADWNVMEVTQEQADAGIIAAFTNPEMTRSLSVAYNEMEEAATIEDVAAEMAAAYTEVQVITINDMSFVTYTIADKDVTGLVTLGGSGIGLYQFVFNPASDADYGPLAMQIASSIAAIEE